MRVGKTRTVFIFAIVFGALLYIFLVSIKSLHTHHGNGNSMDDGSYGFLTDNLQIHIHNTSKWPMLPSNQHPDTNSNNNNPNNVSEAKFHDNLLLEDDSIPELLRPIAALWPYQHLSVNKKLLVKSKVSGDEMHSNCALSANLGIIFVPTTLGHLNETILRRYEKPRLGGVWYPHHCRPVQKVAILVPYRNRADNLNIFTHHMHYFLQQQQLDYGIFVVEQVDNKKFNRAKLFNIGFLLTQMMHDYDCYVLHDIDKLPEDTRFLYHCNADQPKQMPHLFHDSIWDTQTFFRGKRRPKERYYNAHLYKDFFGGVSALSRDQYLTINGMTNNYWGWGAEDDELICRIRSRGYKPIFSQDQTAKYVILEHKADADYSNRAFPNCKKVAKYMEKDGLNNVTFELNSIHLYPLYTLMRVLL